MDEVLLYYALFPYPAVEVAFVIFQVAFWWTIVYLIWSSTDIPYKQFADDLEGDVLRDAGKLDKKPEGGE